MGEAGSSLHRVGHVSSPGLKVIEADLDHAVAVWHNLLIVYWLGETRPGAVVRLTKPLAKLAEQYPEGIGVLQVVGPTTGAPSNEARLALAQLLKSGEGHIVCSALVVPGVGFRMAAARALATGITMLSRLKLPHQVYATVEQAAVWQCSLLPNGGRPAVDPGQIVAAVQHLRTQLSDRLRRSDRH